MTLRSIVHTSLVDARTMADHEQMGWFFHRMAIVAYADLEAAANGHAYTVRVVTYTMKPDSKMNPHEFVRATIELSIDSEV